MYNTTFNRTMSTEEPPNYEDANSTHSSTSGNVPTSHSSSGTVSSSQNSISGQSQSADTVETTPTTITGALTAVSGEADTNFIVADETSGSWQDTVLNNVHKLKNLTSSKNKVSNAIKLSVHFTKDLCEAGVEPTIIDPTKIEYEQGCFVHGFVYIQNTLDKPVPFDMFYVLLEGNFMIDNPKDTKNPIIYKKFLEMFDLSASWNDVYVNRLTTDKYKPYVCPYTVDPRDGSHLGIQLGRLLQPGVLYKRFFTFKIPERLLDSECGNHTLSSHIELPPTMGMSRFENYLYKNCKVKDFAFFDAAVSYSVMTRFIGKRSLYNVDEKLKDIDDTKLINNKGDEFIILKETNNFIRIVPNYHPSSPSLERMKSVEQTLLYKNMVKRLEEHLKNGQKLVDLLERGEFDKSIQVGEYMTQSELEFAKLRQSYNKRCHKDFYADQKKGELQQPQYSIIVPITTRKKSLTSSLLKKPSKNDTGGMVGVLSLNTPQVDYQINYIAPPQFRSHQLLEKLTDLRKGWHLSIPIEFQFSGSETLGNYLPSFKHVNASLTILSLKSDREPLPLELKHDLIYTQQQYPSRSEIQAILCDSLNDPDTFVLNIQKPFQKLSTQLYKYLKELPTSNFKVELDLVNDLKLICYTHTKSISLSVNDVSVSASPLTPSEKFTTLVASQSSAHSSKAIDAMKWEEAEKNEVGQTTMSKKFYLNVNLNSATLLGSKSTAPVSDDYTLIPDFQSCQTARFYCLKLLFVTQDDHTISVKVPVHIVKPE
ncbi:uncharacterized protein KQ657_001858 [Scheffersomyces spartinae]|uniref:Uncharacterized protein n=1 Tax=Scheffersomyces spartinae TaxID=45513 RepID=A0A9P7V744_9ASCO|nr:uncharacterized protein KQ657_001858 [Scheffersomyces spartinae]KAG7192457.1 hypothetical protein KQ657_001858 [Scheffersomyces spartinae]